MTLTVQRKLLKHIQRRKKDFIVTYFKASGAGGQHRNKVETAVRIKDKKTGLLSECSEYKSQRQNKRIAFERLVRKIVSYYEDQSAQSDRLTSMGWSDKIRTYHEPRNVVKDHRTGVSLPYDRVLDGKDIEKFTLCFKADECSK